jgi:hypothetical protein
MSFKVASYGMHIQVSCGFVLRSNAFILTQQSARYDGCAPAAL